MRLVFTEMIRQRVTYIELEHRSGILVSTIKALRHQSATPQMATAEALLNSLGWSLVAVPSVTMIPEAAHEPLEEIGQHFRTDEEALGAAISAAAEWPAQAIISQRQLADKRIRRRIQ